MSIAAIEPLSAISSEPPLASDIACMAAEPSGCVFGDPVPSVLTNAACPAIPRYGRASAAGWPAA